MKLIRFGKPGKERPGIWQPDGVVDLRHHLKGIPDIGRAFFEEGWLARVSRLKVPGQDLQERFGPPVAMPSKIICLGKNYREHAREGGFDIPEAPLLFCKTPNTINGPFDPVLLPRSSTQIDWEVELAVVIGRKGRRISKAAAMDYVAGYTILNDVSARQAQFAQSQWFRGKSFDGFAPLGPALVTPDEVGDVQDLQLTAMVNGQPMQTGNTREMIFDIATLIENISEDITLVPGDIISTGTPAGVGIFRNPPVVLTHGDEVECRVEKIGAIRNRFIRAA
jgi:2,4-didehydro-3-deoxy-L-rhamnonate hydrolase